MEYQMQVVVLVSSLLLGFAGLVVPVSILKLCLVYCYSATVITCGHGLQLARSLQFDRKLMRNWLCYLCTGRYSHCYAGKDTVAEVLE